VLRGIIPRLDALTHAIPAMKKKTLVVLLFPFLAGCSSWNPANLISPYRIDIQQGNVVTQEMLSQLKPGMTPSQVRYVLGTPMIVDPFRNNRWDYAYSLKKNGQIVERRRVTVVFENDVLKGIEGDVVAAKDAQPAAQPAPAKPESVKP
jgi:outer membrane protein assembly factor BamE